MRDGYTGVGGGGNRGSHARHNLEGRSAAGQHQGFLAAAAENEGVSPLQTHDDLARSRPVQKQVIDLVLAQSLAAALLAHENQFRRLGSDPEQRGVKQAVVNYHLGLGQAVFALDRDQPRITRTGAHQVDFSVNFRHVLLWNLFDYVDGLDSRSTPLLG